MMWPAVVGVVSVALLLTAAWCAWLLAERRGLRGEARRLAEEFARADGARTKLGDENRDLLTRLERAEADRQGLMERLADEKAASDLRVVEQREGFESRLAEARREFESLQKQARETFQALAGDALKQANEQFLQLARKTLESENKDAAAELEQRKQAIEAMLKPIRETLDKHTQAVGEMEKNREGAYQGLKQQLVSMMEAQRELRGETQGLVKALRRPEVRGRWGQMQLERVAELAGMVRYCDFFTEHTVDASGSGGDGDGKLRPDMVVKLPSNRTIAVDAKTPIDAYLDSLDCHDDESRLGCLERHVRQIETQVSKLAAKAYQEQFDRSPEFVVLFIPGESFLQAALQVKPELLESAMTRNVLLASPTTLISLLKAVAAGWREQNVADNAKRISDLGVELHERIATATGYVEHVGKHLENAVKAYNQFVGSYESRVLPSARRLKDYGADSAKELPADGELRQVELLPREVRAGG